jgi:hypothetical protein
VSLRPVRFERDRRPAGRDAVLEGGATLALGRVASQPIVGARQLPRAFELRRTARHLLAPRVGRLARAREVLAFRVEGVCNLRPGRRIQ